MHGLQENGCVTACKLKLETYIETTTELSPTEREHQQCVCSSVVPLTAKGEDSGERSWVFTVILTDLSL